MLNNSIAQLLGEVVPEGSYVTVRGWVKTRRDSKAGFSFLNIHDGSCFSAIQSVVPNTLNNYESEVLKLTAGCAVIVSGRLTRSQGKEQAFEIQAESLQVIGWIDEPDSYPISPKHHTLEYLREVAHLRPRTNVIGAVARVRHACAQAIHRFFHERGFFWVNTPIITASDCEGAGEMFRVSTLDLTNLPKTEQGEVDFRQDFFHEPTFLTVSGQLNVEAYCLAMSKVYTFGPTFRSENSNTSRHLAEFWMIEPEVAFADLAEIEQLAESLLKYIFQVILSERADDMNFFAQHIDKSCIDRLERLINANFERMDYGEAINQLKKSRQKFEFPVKWGIDLQSEHERYLAEKLVNGPVIIKNYPRSIKAFYMRLNDDDKTVAAMDILVPGIGELVGGSQREERLEVLDKRMQEMKLDSAQYSWYRDLRRYGSVPHSGFGLGFERIVSYITGVNNLRDITPFPRVPGVVKF